MQYLMSTSIVPAGYTGRVLVRSVTPAEATEILSAGFTSAVGHQSTAEVLRELLPEVKGIVANRVTVKVEAGVVFVCFQLLSRPPEGALLNREALEEIGFSLRVMEFLGE